MEDNKKEEKKELTPEQLKAYAAQAIEKAKKVMEENNGLQNTVSALTMRLNAREIDWAFKVIELKESFDPEFVAKVTKRLQEILEPSQEEEEAKEE